MGNPSFRSHFRWFGIAPRRILEAFGIFSALAAFVAGNDKHTATGGAIR
jgi:hypothetical protein